MIFLNKGELPYGELDKAISCVLTVWLDGDVTSAGCGPPKVCVVDKPVERPPERSPPPVWFPPNWPVVPEKRLVPVWPNPVEEPNPEKPPVPKPVDVEVANGDVVWAWVVPNPVSPVAGWLSVEPKPPNGDAL